MSQVSDVTLDNQGFASFRTELNNILGAMNTNNSGTSRPASAVSGTIWLDTSNATNPELKFFDGTDDIQLAILDTTANTVNWIDSSVTVAIEILNDTSPQLGGNLDTNSHNIDIDTAHGIRDENANEQITFTTTASAVNELTVTNAATGNGPEIKATGGDTNIDLKLTPKGSGKLNLDGIKFPNADGSADQILKTDGSGNLSFADASSGGLSWNGTVKTAAFTASADEGYWCDTSGGTFKVTLPAGSAGATVAFADFKNTWGTNHLTVESNGTEEINGTDSILSIKQAGGAVELVYVNDDMGWIMTQKNGEGAVTQVTGSAMTVSSGGNSTVTDGDFKVEVYTSPGNFTISDIGNPSGFNVVDYFVLAGGGGAGRNSHPGVKGNGGAGGLRQSNGLATGGYDFTQREGSMSVPGLIVTQSTYAVVVGAGGAGAGTNVHVAGSDGSDSSFGGIVATGGGRGVNHSAGPNVGGSGGGGAGIHGPSFGAKGNPSGYFPAEGSDGFRTGGPNNCGDGGSFLQGGQPTTLNRGEEVSAFTSICGPSRTDAQSGPFARGGFMVMSSNAPANSGHGGGNENGQSYAGGSGIVMIRYKFQ